MLGNIRTYDNIPIGMNWCQYHGTGSTHFTFMWILSVFHYKFIRTLPWPYQTANVSAYGLSITHYAHRWSIGKLVDWYHGVYQPKWVKYHRLISTLFCLKSTWLSTVIISQYIYNMRWNNWMLFASTTIVLIFYLMSISKMLNIRSWNGRSRRDDRCLYDTSSTSDQL